MRRWILCLFTRSKVNDCDERPGSALFGERVGERKAPIWMTECGSVAPPWGGQMRKLSTR